MNTHQIAHRNGQWRERSTFDKAAIFALYLLFASVLLLAALGLIL